MKMTYKKWNNLLGWLVFVIAAVVYISTTEPSASLWDCGEFIPTSYKLEVGHPPGAPLFMMIANFFTKFAFGNAEKVALTVNIMSCLAAAATILFLFWTITHLGRRLMGKKREELTKGQFWTIMGAGLVGALAYTFTDTFWFSAVEAEVYALSSLFTAFVVWAMLKWEDSADEPGNERWLVLIAYMMGLSIGVHILNLLTIPALVFIYYFRRSKNITAWGVVKMTALSAVLILLVNNIIIPYTTSVGAWFDRVFNSVGWPVNRGILVYIALLVALLVFGIWYTQKRGKRVANVVVLCLTMILIGYSSYASVLIRASANPPMNSNDPDNPYALLYLLNRDQYGARPLISGVPYSAPVVDAKYATKYYVDSLGKYRAVEVVDDYEYPSEFKTLFPRMWSSSSDAHIEGYKSWGRVSGDKKISYGGKLYEVPTAGENLRYFFAYQLNFMYWRYFLWNFVGRQSDNQSTGEITDGQWLSGIKPIDALFLGPQDNLPDDMKQNKGRNTYFFLPFLLGIIGLLWQLNRDPKNFTVVMWLFVMMGVMLVVYFNTTPGEVRERDYVYAGSFYAFSIWIGLGVAAVKGWIERAAKREKLWQPAVATVICMSVPVLLCAENWDDHDRSGRMVMRDIGYNYLETALPNSILINYGDNDTFPLWYNQEVENIRPDVKIMNQSYLGGGWYVDEMRVRSNESDGVPFSLPRDKYNFTNDIVYIEDVVDYRVPIQQAIDVVASESPATKLRYGDMTFDFLPQHRLALPVNKQNALSSGIVRPEDAHLMVDTVYIDLQGNSIQKPQLMVLDMLAQLDWSRPVYFTQPTLWRNTGLSDYMQYDGYAYRLVPIRTPYTSAGEVGRIDTEYLYYKLMNTYRYGNVKDPRVYVDNFSRYNFNASQVRMAFARLGQTLADSGQKERALQVLDRGMEEIPYSKIGHNFQTFAYADAYYAAGAPEKADSLVRDYAKNLTQWLYYYFTFPDNRQEMIVDDMIGRYRYLEHLTYSLALPNKRYELVNELDKRLEIAELFFGMTRDDKGNPKADIPPVNDRTRKEFLDSIEGHFLMGDDAAAAADSIPPQV
ncbi:MAG: DUF2723 domain-containing protein [Tidjanibacter sp.]|nr:DUF2723 domain-containing protein [Tidjanibacter sp.]